jgi:hypothetical protein
MRGSVVENGIGKTVQLFTEGVWTYHGDRPAGGGAGNGSLTPVNYFSEGEFIYCTYVFKGKPDWYLDVIANPQVEIWLRAAGTQAKLR